MFELGLAASGAVLGGILFDQLRLGKRARDHERWLASWPGVLRSFSGQLRVGVELHTATRGLADGLNRRNWIEQHEQGLRWSEILGAQQDKETQVLSRLVDQHERHGSNLAAGVDRFAERLNQSQRAASLARVAMAPVLAQARLVLFVMPLMVGMVAVFEPDATAKLFTTHEGLSVLALCLILNLVMWAGFRRMAGQLK